MIDLRVPSSTYRLQFNRAFRFADARRIVPYLRELGIGDLYASPLFAATPGSSHGYDITDPTRLSPEIGTRRQFHALRHKLRSHNMGLLLDIVPNHMAATPDNPWWKDVLTHGTASRHAHFFDIDWSAFNGRLLLPILGDRIDRCLKRGELSIELSSSGFAVTYFNNRLPLDPGTYREVLTHSDRPDTLAELIRLAVDIPERDTEDRGLRARLSRRIVRRIDERYKRSRTVQRAIDSAIGRMNSDRRPNGALARLLGRQAYKLRYWRLGADRINYRRFFDITGLAGVRVEDDDVMRETHRLIAGLTRDDSVTGLRIDHIDGLRDPRDYLERLQRLTSDSADRRYVAVEKILVGDETLPAQWPVAGTTGYDFLRAVNDLFVDPGGLNSLSRTYRRVTRRRGSFEDVLYRQKKKIIRRLFLSEVSSLTDQLQRIATEVTSKPPPRSDLRRAIIELAAAFPVYRTYIAGRRISRRDRDVIRRAATEARRQGAPTHALRILTTVLSMQLPNTSPRSTHEQWLDFVLRFQQFTGPAMAKGQEDTAFYTYNPLRSLNEVGAEPVLPRNPVAAFHAHNKHITREWPHTMTASSTHDTKRSEDVRARINVLSELPDEWAERVERWREMNRSHRTHVGGRDVPDANEEILLYQALLGAWPLDSDELAGFPDRMKAFIVKAAREAKTDTSWRSPDPKHERALEHFVERILRNTPRNSFRRDLLDFLKPVEYWGHINSLAQTVLKIATPGVPDFYQGCETWNLSLVDPDNRRPVHFRSLQRTLATLARDKATDPKRLLESIVRDWRDGRIKMYTIWTALACRRENHDLFSLGRYEPLRASGVRGRNIVSFSRSYKGEWIVAIAPRLMASELPVGATPLGTDVWGRSSIALPNRAAAEWRNVLTGEEVSATRRGRSHRIAVADALNRLPVALLVSK